MNLERGFRRLALVISFAAATAGLAVTSYDTYKTVQYVSATKGFMACVERTRSSTPTVEDFKMLPDSWRPIIVPGEKLDDAERLRRWTEGARGYKLNLCGYILIGEPAHLKRAGEMLWFTFLWFPYMSSESYTLALLPVIWGLLLSAGVSTIPWGMFYLVRWIAHGFKV